MLRAGGAGRHKDGEERAGVALVGCEGEWEGAEEAAVVEGKRSGNVVVCGVEVDGVLVAGGVSTVPLKVTVPPVATIWTGLVSWKITLSACAGGASRQQAMAAGEMMRSKCVSFMKPFVF